MSFITHSIFIPLGLAYPMDALFFNNQSSENLIRYVNSNFSKSMLMELLSFSLNHPLHIPSVVTALTELMKSHPIGSYLEDSSWIYSILPHENIGAESLELIKLLSRSKHDSGLTFQQESIKILQELLRQFNSKSLADILPCSLRSSLLQIWVSVPRSIPPIDLLSLALSWLSQGFAADLVDILKILRKLQKLEVKMIFEISLIRNILEICVESNKAIDFVQFSLLVLPDCDIINSIRAINRGLSHADWLRTWVSLNLITPLLPASYGIFVSQVIFFGSVYPWIGFMRSYLIAWLLETDSLHKPLVVESALRVVIVRISSSRMKKSARNILEHLNLSPSLISDTLLAHYSGLETLTVELSMLSPVAQDLVAQSASPKHSHEELQVPSQVVSKRRNPVGVQNFNNTCYLNAFLQALVLATGFTARVFKAYNESSLCSGLSLVFCRILISQHSYIEISSFLRILPAEFRSGEERDALEGGLYLLENLKDISHYEFEGILEHKIKCNRCQRVSVREERFYNLTFTVPTEKSTFGKITDIQSLLSSFCDQELLEGDNKYFCDVCADKHDALKWVTISKCPNYLIVQLARFSFDASLGDFRKENTPINIINGLTISNSSYELFAAIMHEGDSISKGHYTSICKYGNTWFTINDSSINELRGTDVETTLNSVQKPDNNSYVLFLRSRQENDEKYDVAKVIYDTSLSMENAAIHL
jgi:ubiquitin C-terminal hydrolase